MLSMLFMYELGENILTMKNLFKGLCFVIFHAVQTSQFTSRICTYITNDYGCKSHMKMQSLFTNSVIYMYQNIDKLNWAFKLSPLLCVIFF